MSLAKPQQNLALPLAVQKRIDAMFAGETGLSGPEILEYFATQDDTVEQYPWSGGAPSRKQIFQDCLTRFSKNKQLIILREMLLSDIYKKYPAPSKEDKEYLLAWIEDQSTPRSESRLLEVNLDFTERIEPQPIRKWDVFVSHAHEDKAAIAEPLSSALTQQGVRVWYDNFELKIGDSLRKEIDRGLTYSRFGIVILSHAFFAKRWPQMELDGLFAKETNDVKVILPVWHRLNAAEVNKYSPLLASRLAVLTEHGLSHVVQELMQVLNPSHTTG